MADSALSRDIERVRQLARVLDTAVGIPGTRVRFGADAVLGLIPGAGDALSAGFAAYPVVVALRHRLPRSLVLRLMGNIALDTLVGTVPLLGDLFDVGFKANVRNHAVKPEFRPVVRPVSHALSPVLMKRVVRRLGLCTLVAGSSLFTTTSSMAQSRDDVWRYGISIGDSRRVKGLRLNFRDRRMEHVNGINLTLWTPYDDAVGGTVNGLALGLPQTGADRINGIALGLFGISAEEEFRGIAIAGLGAGGGGDMSGIILGGLGAGTGRDVSGVAIGGLGVGAGGDLTGIMIGGLGAGGGGNARGLLLGGIGGGVGGNLDGIAIGGIGVGAGGSGKGLVVGGIGAGMGGRFTGIGIGGIGVGVGGDARGLVLGGIGAGVGGDFSGIGIGGVGVGIGGVARGLLLGGIGVGGSDVRGVALGGVAVGGGSIEGLAVAGAFTRIERFGTQKGVALSPFNYMKGLQRGLTIGVVNYAYELDGIQVGLINIARSNRSGRKVLPIANWKMR